jgi:hypothetical protein
MISLITSSTTDPRDMTCLSPSNSSLFLIYVLSPGLVTRVTQRVLQVDHAFLFLPEHRFSVGYVLLNFFVDYCVPFSCDHHYIICPSLIYGLWYHNFFLTIIFCFICTFLFGHCVVCFSSIYGFGLPLWYLQTLLGSVPIKLYYLVTSGEIKVSFAICSHS